jgi:hypothetical protein
MKGIGRDDIQVARTQVYRLVAEMEHGLPLLYIIDTRERRLHVFPVPVTVETGQSHIQQL